MQIDILSYATGGSGAPPSNFFSAPRHINLLEKSVGMLVYRFESIRIV